ncbi:unnamed protein product [Pedinophyceae sp. YPF-701]|nr:unnamed protein product [Pedinophyceae sp. YPF-701]
MPGDRSAGEAAPAPENDPCYDVVIIGTGLAGLAAATRLPRGVRAVAVSQAGAWLAGERQRAARLEAELWRYPSTTSLHADPEALRSFAKEHGRLNELLKTSASMGERPTSRLMLDFQDAVVIPALPDALRQPMKATVLSVASVRPTSGPSHCTSDFSASQPAGTTQRSDGNARNAAKRDLTSPGQACVSIALSGGRRLLARAAIVATRFSRPFVPAVLERAAADAGGGDNATSPPSALQHASALDVRALEARGVRKAVVVGGGMDLVVSDVGASRGWCGQRNLRAYHALGCPRDRAALCRSALQGGSITPDLAAALKQLEKSGRLEILQSLSITAATLSTPPSPASADPKPRWTLVLSSATLGQRSLLCDAVVCATGTTFDVRDTQHPCASLPPTRIVAGAPWLDDATQCWPGAPVFVLGGLARLAAGPLSHTPGVLQRQTAQVAAALRAVLAPVPAVDKAPPPWIAAPGGVLDAVSDPAVTAGDCGVAVDGEAPPAGPLRAVRAPTVVDTAVLPAGRSRAEVQAFRWEDRGWDVRIDIPLPESVDGAGGGGGVFVVATRSSLDVWAVCASCAHRLHVPRLYACVQARRTAWAVDRGGRRVVVTLVKESDAPWYHLRS